MTEEEKFTQQLKELYKSNFNKKKNRSVGIDGTTSESFKANIDTELSIMARKLLNNTYQFSLYKEKLISKGRDSKPRAISIPTNRDKLLLKFLQLFLKESYKEDLVSDSVHIKINDIKQQINVKKYNSFIKLDICSFFDNINHDILLGLLYKKGISDPVYTLIEQAIKQTTVAMAERNIEKQSNSIGVPQGLSISGILADIYLLSFDIKHKQNDQYQYYRFVDDMLVLCNQNDIDTLMQTMVSDLKKLGLETHAPKKESQKTAYGCIQNGFQFLGYQFKGSQLSVRPSSIDKAYAGINKVFLKYHKHAKKEDLKELYRRLNLKITGCVVKDKQYGWLYFFSYINDQTLLHKLDAYVKKACKRFDVPYDTNEIKKYSRAYYELKNIEKSNYIPKFGNSINLGREVVKAGINDKEAEAAGSELLQEIEEDIDFY